MRRSVVVVMPVLNESGRLESVLWRLHRRLAGRSYQVMVVDDGSTDDTAEVAERLMARLPVRLIRHGRTRGYAAALRTGMLAGREMANVVMTMEAGGSDDPSLIPVMVDAVSCGSDVVVASRYVPGGRVLGLTFYRKALCSAADVVLGRLARIPGVKDCSSGYRAYSAALIDRLVDRWGRERFIRETGRSVGLELLLRAELIGASIAEVPLVRRYDRAGGIRDLSPGCSLSEGCRLRRRILRETVRSLSSRVDCVVTDLRHGADWASGAGVDTLLIDDGKLMVDSRPNDRKGSLAALVRLALNGGDARTSAIA